MNKLRKGWPSTVPLTFTTVHRAQPDTAHDPTSSASSPATRSRWAALTGLRFHPSPCVSWQTPSRPLPLWTALAHRVHAHDLVQQRWPRCETRPWAIRLGIATFGYAAWGGTGSFGSGGRPGLGVCGQRSALHEEAPRCDDLPCWVAHWPWPWLACGAWPRLRPPREAPPVATSAGSGVTRDPRTPDRWAGGSPVR